MQPLTSSDVVRVDPGTPIGSEAGMFRPAMVVTAQRVLLIGWISEVEVEASPGTGLTQASAAQAQHVQAIPVERVVGQTGN